MATRKLTSMLLMMGFILSMFHPLTHAITLEQAVLSGSALHDFSDFGHELTVDNHSVGQRESSLLTNHQDHDGHFVDAHCETCHVFAHFMLPGDDRTKIASIDRRKQSRPGSRLWTSRHITLDRPPRTFS